MYFIIHRKSAAIMPSIRRKVKAAATPGELRNPQTAKPWWRLMLVNPRQCGISGAAVLPKGTRKNSHEAAKPRRF
jgi:hypothetical protein